jgi:hypothetical protein
LLCLQMRKKMNFWLKFIFNNKKNTYQKILIPDYDN